MLLLLLLLLLVLLVSLSLFQYRSCGITLEESNVQILSNLVYVHSLDYSVSSSKRPCSNTCPSLNEHLPPRTKYQTSPPRKCAPPPLPSPITSFSSRDTKKICFYCHFIDNSVRKLWNGTKVVVMTWLLTGVLNKLPPGLSTLLPIKNSSS